MNTQPPPRGGWPRLRETYADVAAYQAAFRKLAKQLSSKLVILRCEGVVLDINTVDAAAPRVHLDMERMLPLFANVCVIGNAPKAKVVACLKRAGMLSNFRDDAVFGTDGLKHPDDPLEQYLMAAQSMGFFTSNAVVIESAGADVTQAALIKIHALRYCPPPQGHDTDMPALPETDFATLGHLLLRLQNL